MARPGRREIKGPPVPADWVPTPLPASDGLLAPVLAHAFSELGVSVSLWVSQDFWHSLYLVPHIISFEYEYGVAPKRWAHNRRCLARAIGQRRAVLAEYGGFRDLFVPVQDARGIAGVVVAGPFATERPTKTDVLQRWYELSGSHGRINDPSFSRYLEMTLATLTLEGDWLGTFQRLMVCFADLLGGRGNIKKVALEAQNKRLELREVRLTERMWETTRKLVDPRTNSSSVPLDHGDMAALGIQGVPQHVMVGLLITRDAEPDAIDDLLRRDAFLRACVIHARKRGGIVCGPVGNHGVVFLLEQEGTLSRARSDLAVLASKVATIARRFRFKLHVGLDPAGREPLATRYLSALRAAEKALSEGKGIVDGEPRPEGAADRLREQRSELGKVVADRPKLLVPRFDRYIEAVLAHSSYRFEQTRIELEAGFERLMEPLLGGGFIDRKSQRDLFSSMERSSESARTVMDLVASFRGLVSEAERALSDPTLARQDRGIGQALKIMREHFGEPLTLGGVARVAGFAPAYFSRLFKRVEGVPFARYLHQLRLAHAQQMLKETTLSVEQVQKLSGFQNRTNFHRAFKRAVKMTPIGYRERWA